jgi:ABC-type glutathione transport system ATPase component
MSTLDTRAGRRPDPPGERQPVLLALEHVSRVHGAGSAVPVHALREVSLEVRVGELVAVMGPSGSASPPCCTWPAASTRPPAAT